MTDPKAVFFDVDTQLDFLYPAGSLYVPGAEKITHSLATLTRYAAANRVKIISTADAHTEDDPEFKTWKPHCIVGTVGQQKASVTLTNQALVLRTDEGALDEIRSNIEDTPQIIVEKQKLDVFTNPNLRPLLEALNPSRYVLYGVVTELCVRCAALGLLETGAQVQLVTDAIKSLTESDERDFITHFQAQGGLLTTVSKVTISA